MDQVRVQIARRGDPQHAVMLGEIGDSRDHGIIFFEENDLMSGTSRVLSNSLPKVRPVNPVVQAESIHSIPGDILRPHIYPPVVKIRVSAPPVVVGHPPAAAAKPVGMFFDQRTETQNAVHMDVQKHPDSTLVRVGDEGFEFLGSAQGRVNGLRLDVRVLGPDVIEMMRVGE